MVMIGTITVDVGVLVMIFVMVLYFKRLVQVDTRSSITTFSTLSTSFDKQSKEVNPILGDVCAGGWSYTQCSTLAVIFSSMYCFACFGFAAVSSVVVVAVVTAVDLVVFVFVFVVVVVVVGVVDGTVGIAVVAVGMVILVMSSAVVVVVVVVVVAVVVAGGGCFERLWDHANPLMSLQLMLMLAS